MLESETWQPGKVILNKENTIHTYLKTTNYWAPLHEEEDDDHIEDSNITKVVQSIANTNSNKWMCLVERHRSMKLVINLGAITGRNEPHKERKIKQRSLLTRQYQIASILQNQTPL
jgi:hypothetical protein